MLLFGFYTNITILVAPRRYYATIQSVLVDSVPARSLLKLLRLLLYLQVSIQRIVTMQISSSIALCAANGVKGSWISRGRMNSASLLL